VRRCTPSALCNTLVRFGFLFQKAQLGLVLGTAPSAFTSGVSVLEAGDRRLVLQVEVVAGDDH